MRSEQRISYGSEDSQGGEEWKVRPIDQSPSITMEGFDMHRILDGSGLEGTIGCEHVVLKRGERLEPHVHEEAHAIILVLGGKGYAVLDGEKYPITTHDVINVPPGVLHGLEAGRENLVVFGFQYPGIVREEKYADIYFDADGRQGEVVR